MNIWKKMRKDKTVNLTSGKSNGEKANSLESVYVDEADNVSGRAIFERFAGAIQKGG